MGTLQQKDAGEIPAFLRREQKPMANETTSTPPATPDKGVVETSKAAPAQTNGSSKPSPATNGTGVTAKEPEVKKELEPLRPPSDKNRSGTPSQKAAEDRERTAKEAKQKPAPVKGKAKPAPTQAKPAAPAKKAVAPAPAPQKGKAKAAPAPAPTKGKQAAPAKKPEPVKAKAKESSVEKDQYGFKKGSLKSKAAALYADAKGATLLEIKTKTGSSQLNVLVELEQRGYRVDRKKEQGKGKRPITRYFLKGKARK